MSWRYELYPTIQAQELAELCLGEQLGDGGFRRVLVWKPDPLGTVAKIETQEAQFANAFEWHLWHRAQGTPLERWLAPCVDISANGLVLLQRRTMPLEDRQLPSRIPAIFKDVKRTNFGLIGKRVVCHDYGLIEFRQSDHLATKLVKANW